MNLGVALLSTTTTLAGTNEDMTSRRAASAQHVGEGRSLDLFSFSSPGIGTRTGRAEGEQRRRRSTCRWAARAGEGSRAWRAPGGRPACGVGEVWSDDRVDGTALEGVLEATRSN